MALWAHASAFLAPAALPGSGPARSSSARHVTHLSMVLALHTRHPPLVLPLRHALVHAILTRSVTATNLAACKLKKLYPQISPSPFFHSSSRMMPHSPCFSIISCLGSNSLFLAALLPRSLARLLSPCHPRFSLYICFALSVFLRKKYADLQTIKRRAQVAARKGTCRFERTKILPC